MLQKHYQYVHRQCGRYYKPIIERKTSDSMFVELKGCTRNLNDCIVINRMNIFKSRHRFMVTTMDIIGYIANVTIAASSTVTIYSTITISTPIIFYMPTMAAGIGQLDSRTVKEKMTTTIFVSFTATITSRFAIIICPLHRCCVYDK